MLLPLGILASSGGVPLADYELISTTVLGSAAASVTFSGLGTSAAAYKHLQIRAVARSATNYDNLILRFNGDSGANYSWHQLYGNGSIAGSSASTSASYANIGLYSGTDSASTIFGPSVVDILDFASTTKNKTTRALTGVPDSNNVLALRSSAWYSTAAVTSIVVSGASGNNLVTGSRFSLYGLKG